MREKWQHDRPAARAPARMGAYQFMVPQQPTSVSPQPSPATSIRSVISTGEPPPASSGPGWGAALQAKLRSRGVLILLGVKILVEHTLHV